MLVLTNMDGLFERSDGKKRRPVSWPCPRPAHFSILVTPTRVDALVQLSGTLDLESTDAFDDCVATLLAEHPRRLVLELSSLEAIDEAAAARFTRANSKAKDHGSELILDSPNDRVLTMLERGASGTQFVVRKN
jgi:anti-anti-sigma factor